MRVALAQINPTVGDLKGNAKKILEYIKKANKFSPDIIAFPELALTGYPPEDLLLKPHFISDTQETFRQLINKIDSNAVIVLGTIDGSLAKGIYNSAGIIYKKKLKAIYHKIHLPNYGVFDEKRYFSSGTAPFLINVKKNKIGLTICEDIWAKDGPHLKEIKKGANIILNISASPYYRGKLNERINLLKKIAKKNKVWILYVNIVGGQDELVFDGSSIIINSKGEIYLTAKQFEEDLIISDIEFKKERKKIKFLDELEEIYNALVLGTKDYVKKNGFKKVVIGLSGGIDSSLTATIACDALGNENVIGVAMPSKFSSSSSISDAELLVRNLGIRFLKIPIHEIYKNYIKTLKPIFKNLPFDKAEENIQARIRGNILMALSNKFGWLVLTTGNKSETSTGYCTLYGDMAGGFAIIKDVPKTFVYKLAKWRNKKENKDLIPKSIFKKAPSAELRPGQKDQDTLPFYDILDKIIHFYVEEDKSLNRIIKLGIKEKVVKKVISMIDKTEYKRRQAPPGIKITPKAFGKDRRMPITNKYLS